MNAEDKERELKDDVPVGTKLFKINPATGKAEMATLMDTTVLERDNNELFQIKCPECHSLLMSCIFREEGWIKKMSIVCVSCLKKGRTIECNVGTGEKHSDVLRDIM